MVRDHLSLLPCDFLCTMLHGLPRRFNRPHPSEWFPAFTCLISYDPAQVTSVPCTLGVGSFVLVFSLPFPALSISSTRSGGQRIAAGIWAVHNIDNGVLFFCQCRDCVAMNCRTSPRPHLGSLNRLIPPSDLLSSELIYKTIYKTKQKTDRRAAHHTHRPLSKWFNRSRPTTKQNKNKKKPKQFYL